MPSPKGFEEGFAQVTNQREKITFECASCGDTIVASPRSGTGSYPTVFDDCEPEGPPYVAVKKEIGGEVVWSKNDDEQVKA